MSIRSIRDGGTLTKDPDAARVLTWDWDADLAEGAKIVTSTWHISPPGALVADPDTDSIASDGRSTSVRLSGGTDRQNYTVTNRIVTDSSPSETEDASVVVQVREQ